MVSNYFERKAAGICTYCGFKRARPGKTECFECARRNADRRKEYYYVRHPDAVSGGSRFAVTRDGGETVFTGTAKEISLEFYVSVQAVYHAAKYGNLILREYSVNKI